MWRPVLFFKDFMERDYNDIDSDDFPDKEKWREIASRVDEEDNPVIIFTYMKR